MAYKSCVDFYVYNSMNLGDKYIPIKPTPPPQTLSEKNNNNKVQNSVSKINTGRKKKKLKMVPYKKREGI